MDEHKPPPIDVDAEIRKAITLRRDGTYTSDADFISHIHSIITSAANDGARDRDQLERMIHKYITLRDNQKKYFKHSMKHGIEGKALLRDCKEMEAELDKKAHGLLSLGYNIDRFKNQPVPKQPKLL